MDTVLKPDARALRGKRYIAYARCATKQGSFQSLRRQMRLIHLFADSLQMRCAGEDRLPGVNGFSPTLRTDLKRLLVRKHEHDDFDVLIMADHARLTRSHETETIEAIFSLLGVRIVYLTNVGCGRKWHSTSRRGNDE